MIHKLDCPCVIAVIETETVYSWTITYITIDSAIAATSMLNYASRDQAAQGQQPSFAQQTCSQCKYTMETMPDELIAQIFQHLQPDSLVNAALVSKKLGSITQSVLYAHLSLENGLPDRLCSQIEALLHTLLARPKLRKYAKSITLSVWLPLQSEEVEFADFSESDLDELCDANIALHSLLSRGTLKYRLKEPCQDAMNAVLLGLLPNLVSITLERNVHNDQRSESNLEDNVLACQLLSQASAPSNLRCGFLQNLREVHLIRSCYERSGGWSLNFISSVFKIPSLRTLKVSGCRRNGDPWSCVQRASNIEYLSLLDFDLTSDDIAAALRSCRSLKSFVCVQRCRLCDERPGDLDYRRIYRELLPFKATLKALCLHDPLCSTHENETPWGATIGSLTPFTQLENLMLDENALYSNSELPIPSPLDLLPQSLVWFTFITQNDSFPSHFILKSTELLMSHPKLRAVEMRDIELDIEAE